MPRRPHTSRQAIRLLSILAGKNGWSHGYDLCAEADLASGTLYPLLARLADDGHLEAKWEDSPIEGSPRRHLYRLTASGRALAEDRLEEFGPRHAEWSAAT